ncbi:MAG: valine--tRNA ligase [Nitrososphaeraceae archaeon]
MKSNITSKSWNHKIESEILEKWNYSNLYNFDNSSDKKKFIIDTPPPYPSGRPWHIGAAAHYSQIDMIARTARMKDYNVLFPIGIDRNGLPVEIYTEKKHKIRMRNTDRKKFLELCKTSLDDLETEMISIMKNLGLSCNFENYYRTDSVEFRKFTQSTFIDLWKRDLIYISNRPNNYCTNCGTTIADAEIIYEEMETTLTYIKFKIKNDNKNIIIASTRPELLCSCQAIIVHPDDERYLEFQNKYANIPFYDRYVPILTHPSAKRDFGSGAVMVCSYGDHNDVQLFRELNLNEIVVLDKNGKTTNIAGKYSNLSVTQARKKIIEDLRQNNFLEKEEKIMHRTPLCERSKTPIEIIPLQDYYLKQLDFVDTLDRLSDDILFYPEIHRRILKNWLNSVSIDWPISRRRFYGTEIPVWFCKKCDHPHVPNSGKYYQPWNESAPFNKCNKCLCEEFVGEKKTFDTWMDSSITPLFISKNIISTSVNHNIDTYPVHMRPQAKDIVRTWLYYTMLRCYQLTNKLPWSSVWIMGYGVDERGKKMSKSKGNVIDPYPIIQKYGADTFRFWSASESNLGQDFRCSEQSIFSCQKFLSKIWNLGRFISSFPKISNISDTELTYTDKWIISELNKFIKICKNGYNNYNFFIPSNSLRDFTWNIFAPHYIEMVKKRVYDESENSNNKSAVYTIHKCFSTILLLLAPICPFITEELWHKIYSNSSIHLEKFPEPDNISDGLQQHTQDIINFNSLVWNKKKTILNPSTGKQLSLKDPITLTIPKNLILFKEDLKSMHNIVDK